ncbi:MAG: quinolinate synthase NadA [Nitrososphaerales archaeon]|mgnify:FL=1|nr:quinolinate synthase NadA [Nitrososphaerales archaeon]
MIITQINTSEINFREAINELREEKNALILSHNYQIPEIQDLADVVGDSLNLSLQALKSDKDLIVFCGVTFMAETASILAPNKKVVIPDLKAGCSLADTINVQQLREWKDKHPNAVVISYINTSAAIKAESDYCCTSSNAVKVVKEIPQNKEILFLPDLFLGAYIENMTGRKMHIWPGECHVHAKLTANEINTMKNDLPDADFLVHPECGCVSNILYELSEGNIKNDNTKILSTDGMIKYANQSNAKEFVVATETGILHQLQKQNPEKKFHPVKDDAVCEYMKMITLEKLYRSINEEIYEVKVPEEIAKRAIKPITRMINTI